MRNFIRTMFLVPVLALPACGGGDDGSDSEVLALITPAELGEEFVLGHGDSIDVGDLTLKFTAVTAEERCPTGPTVTRTCVWAGNARIALAASNGQLSNVLLLDTGYAESRFTFFAGHIIELRRLDPWPSHDTQRPLPEEYVATLFVDGLAVPAGN